MNADERSGLAASEQQTEPISAAGCKEKVNRSVSWTAHSAGFAELRSRAFQARMEANNWQRRIEPNSDGTLLARACARYWAFDEMLEWLDELEADAKDAS